MYIHLSWKVVKKQNLSFTSNSIHISLNSCSHNRTGAQFVQVTRILQFHPIQTTKTLLQHQSTEVTLLLLCPPQANDIYIYLSINPQSMPPNWSIKHIQCWHLSFQQSWIPHLFSIVGSNLSYTDDLNSTNFSHLQTIFLPKKIKGIGHRIQKAQVELLQHFYFYFYVIIFLWVCNLLCAPTLMPLDFAHAGNVSGSTTTIATKLLLKLSPAQ